MKTKSILLLLFTCMASLDAAAQVKDASGMLYEAIYNEEVTGDLKKATELLNTILKDCTGRRVECAQAIYHLGLIAERSGDAGTKKAESYYVRLIEQYPDAGEYAALARTRMDKLRNASTFTDPRDGHKYKWVKIGDQTWMAENLAYMPHINPLRKQEYGIWVYEYNGENVAEAKATDNYQKYGCLYDWTSAMDIEPKYLEGPWSGDSINRQGLCPPGWHLPTDKEFKILEKSIGMPDSLLNDERGRGGRNRTRFGIVNVPPTGSFLKASTGWLSDGGGDGSSGFNALAAGQRQETYQIPMEFESLGYATRFWTSTIADSVTVASNEVDNAAWYRELSGYTNEYRTKDDVYRGGAAYRINGYSVRCLKNTPEATKKAAQQLSPMLAVPNITTNPAIWKTPQVDTLFPKEKGATGPIICDNVLMVACKDSIIYGYDLNTLRELWKVKLPDKCSQPGFAFPDGRKVLYMSGNSVNSIDYKTGELKWRYPYTGLNVGCTDSANFYLSEYNIRNKDQTNTLVCLDKVTGAVKWQTPVKTRLSAVLSTNGQILLYNTTKKDSGRIPGRNDSTCLKAFDCKTGIEDWSFTRPGSSSLSDPLITKDFSIYNGGDYYFYMLDNKTGKPFQRFFINVSSIFGDPIIDKDILYVGAQNQSFYAFDLKSGFEKWRFKFNSSLPGDGFNETSVIIDDFIISGTAFGGIYCLNKNTGKPVWKTSVSRGTYFHPVVHDKKIYLSTRDGLIRIDPLNYH